MRYILNEVIGFGGMGEVFRAHDRLTGNTVALKRLSVSPDVLEHIEDDSKNELLLSLAHEFQLMASLRHPNIVEVYDYGFDVIDNVLEPYMVIELVEHAQRFSDAGKNLSLRQKVDLVIHTLEALAYLHRRGIIHCDLKPANVLVTPDHQPKLLDFGLAMLRGESGNLMGTLAYTAPELLEDDNCSPDERSDLYGLGVMAYELFADGKRPFNGKSPDTLIAAILDANPAPLEIEPSLAQAVAKLMARHPAGRFHSAAEAVEAFALAINEPLPPERAEVREGFLQAARFVGREDELYTLLDALTRAEGGQGEMWMIGGESGVGKTRFVDEIAIRAILRQTFVLRGHGVEGGGLPYQSWRDPLRLAVLEVQLSDFQMSVLKPLIPDIEQLSGRTLPDAPHLQGASEQQRLALTVVDVLRSLKRPLLLLLDDLQWTAESFELLKIISGRVDEFPWLIIATYRDDEAPDLPSHFPHARTLKLPRLSDEAISELALSMLGEVTPELIKLLKRETEGNVFFMVEIVRALAEDAGRLANIGKNQLPDSVSTGGVRDLIRRRLNRLPSWTLPPLKLAAVGGYELDLLVIEELIDEPLIPDWFMTCANMAILQYNGRWTFAHDKIRQMVLETIAPCEKPALHQRIAETIESIHQHDDAYSIILTEHWNAAGDAGKELHYAISAGEKTHTLAQYHEALRYFRRALDITEDEQTRAMLYTRLGMTCEKIGDYPQARIYLSAALDIDTPDSALRAQAMTLLCRVLRQQGQYAEAQEYGEMALRLCEETGNLRERAHALGQLGTLFLMMQKFDLAQQHLEESLTLTKIHGSQSELAAALSRIASLFRQLEDYEKAEWYYLESLNLRKQVGDGHGVAFSQTGLGMIAYVTGDYARARWLHEESLDTLRAIGDMWGVANVLINLGQVVVKQRDDEAIAGYYSDALKLGWKIGAVSLMLEAITSVAAWRIDLETPERIARWLTFVLHHPNATNDSHAIIYPILDPIHEKIAPDVFNDIAAQSRVLPLETVVEEILEVLGR